MTDPVKTTLHTINDNTQGRKRNTQYRAHYYGWNIFESAFDGRFEAWPVNNAAPAIHADTYDQILDMIDDIDGSNQQQWEMETEAQQRASYHAEEDDIERQYGPEDDDD